MSVQGTNGIGFVLSMAAMALLHPAGRNFLPTLSGYSLALFLLILGGGFMLADGSFRRALQISAFLIGALIALFVGIILLAAGWLWVQGHLTVTVVLLIVSLGGAGLFYIRLHWRCMYGVSEAFAGLTLSIHRALNTADVTPEFAAFILTAGVYLVVRGLDNIHQGWIAPKPDRIARWFVSQIRHGKSPQIGVPGDE